MSTRILARQLARRASPRAPRRLIASTSTSYMNEDDAEGSRAIELIEASLDKTKAAHQKTDEAHIRRALLTTRSESLSLYRAVIRASVFFVWRDDRGRVWRDVIRDSARQEFDVGRHERDPEMVNRMLLTGRDALDRTVGKFLERRATIQKEEDRSRDAGRDRAGARASDLRDPPLT